MKIFIGLDMKGDVFITDDREKMPEKMMRLQEMDIPDRGWKRNVNIVLKDEKIR